jgi:hypothetical protein
MKVLDKMINNTKINLWIYIWVMKKNI